MTPSRHVAQFWVWIPLSIVTCALALLPAPAQAQTDVLPASRPVVKRGHGTPIIDGHGWLAFRETPDPASGRGHASRTVILHLPPRTGAFDLRGVLRPATEFADPCAALAWWRNRVYIALPDEPRPNSSPPTRLRRILTLSAIRDQGDWYEYQPSGRAEVLPALDGDSDLLGFAASPRGPAALLRAHPSPSDASPNPALWILLTDKWRRALAPWESNNHLAPPAPTSATLLNWRDGLALAIPTPSREALQLWIGRVDPPRGDAADPLTTVRPTIEWTQQTFPLVSGSFDARPYLGGGLTFVEAQYPADDALLAWSWDASSALTLVRLRPSGPIILSQTTGIPPAARVIPMASPGEVSSPSGAVAFTWGPGVTTPLAAASAESSRPTIREISALTGRDLYSGPTREIARVEQRRLQSFVVLVLLTAVGVLVFVLRGDPQVIAKLPATIRLADPIKRLLAAILDYAPSAIVVALAQGRSALVLLMPDTILGGGGAADIDLLPLGLALGVTVIHTTLGEWLLGRSIGKFILGLRVVSAAGHGIDQGTAIESVGDHERTPRLWQAAARNLVRWTVPLLAVFALLDIAGRHPGDLAARTLVVADKNDGS